ncbi:hypothetical protein ACW9UR_10080 [Halovulum sp. GXIMD14794]
MERASRRILSGALAAWMILVAAPVWSVDSTTVGRFVRLSDRFHAQLPNSPIAGFDAGQRQSRAVCILTRFESGFGSGGVSALMKLMDVLSKDAQFDDRTIVAFDERYGPDYRRIQEECTRAARSS